MCAPDVIENQDYILRLTKETMPLVSLLLAALRAQKSVYVTCMITELPLSRSSEVQRENTIHMWKREIYKLNVYAFVSALYGAIENGQVDKARTILESTDIDVNK